jgi:DNA adenine methylase
MPGEGLLGGGKMAKHEITCSFSNEGTRNEVRMRVIQQMAAEDPGNGNGNDASQYIYYVETLKSGDRVYLQRPANLHNGFDFLVCVENANYAAQGKRKRNYPKHDDLKADLQRKKAENPQMYAKLYTLLKKVYQCRDVGDEEMRRIRFASGLPVDHVLKAIKWLFIEQDIRYWNYSGRNMTWRIVPTAENAGESGQKRTHERRQLTAMPKENGQFDGGTAAALQMGPFVKWAGGKKQLLEKLKEHVPASFGTYYEPFIGGGALLLDLQPKKAVINDINEQLLNVYMQLKKDAEAVIAAVNSYDAADCNKDRYMELRSRYNQKIMAHELDAQCAAMMIWLNKHCFNGLYRVNSKGLFNVPYNNKTSGPSVDAENLRNIGRYLREAEVDIRQSDFEIACADVKPGDFVYFDSPYVPISDTANFTDYTKDGFSYESHRRLANLFRRLDSMGAFLMLSNHDVPLVRELYSGYKIETVDVRRNINRDSSKRFGKEVIITNFDK